MMMRIREAAVAAAILSLCAGWGWTVDVPTWQVGDWWDMARTFDLTLDTTEPLTLAVTLATEEAYRLTVAEISDRVTTDAGTVRVYRRTRSAGTLAGQGTANISGIPLNLRWEPGGTTAGEDWTAVGDLARVHEQFSLTASLQAQVILWMDIATVTLDAALDFGPTHEMLDFPIETIGEEWRTTVTQHIAGRFRVVWNADFPLWPGGTPPDDLDEVFDQSVPTGFRYVYVGREAHGDYPDTYHADIQPAGAMWYEPSIKEFAEILPGDLDFGGGNQLANFATRVTDAFLQQNPALSILELVPERPYRGEWVQIIGMAALNSPVVATILEEGSSDSTVSDGTGRFELLLQCPDHDDHTPANDDAGSFGVEILAAGTDRKVVTVQVDLPPTSARRSWPLYR